MPLSWELLGATAAVSKLTYGGGQGTRAVAGGVITAEDIRLSSAHYGIIVNTIIILSPPPHHTPPVRVWLQVEAVCNIPPQAHAEGWAASRLYTI